MKTIRLMQKMLPCLALALVLFAPDARANFDTQTPGIQYSPWALSPYSGMLSSNLPFNKAEGLLTQYAEKQNRNDQGVLQGVNEGNNDRRMAAQTNNVGQHNASVATLPREQYNQDATRAAEMRARTAKVFEDNKGSNDGGRDMQQNRARTLQRAAKANSNIGKNAFDVINGVVQGMNTDERNSNGTAIEGVMTMTSQCRSLGLCDVLGTGGVSTTAANDEIDNAAVNLGKLNEMPNIPLNATDPRFQAVVTAIKIRCDWPESFVRQPKAGTTQGATHNMKVLSSRAKCADVAKSIVGNLRNKFSLPSNCPGHQEMDKLRTKVGHTANRDACLSNNQLKDAAAALEQTLVKQAQTEPNNSAAGNKDKLFTEATRQTMDYLMAPNNNQVASVGNAGGDLSHLALLEDKRFIALMADPELPTKLAEFRRNRLPEIFARQNLLIASTLKHNDGDQLNSVMVADSGAGLAPASMPQAVKPDSLAQVFGVSGVGVYTLAPQARTQLPKAQEVNYQLPVVEGGIKAIPVSYTAQ